MASLGVDVAAMVERSRPGDNPRCGKLTVSAKETIMSDWDADLLASLAAFAVVSEAGSFSEAARRLATMAAAGELDPSQIDEDRFGAELATAGLPALDLMIRTSGEKRVSNFLLWQSAYAELVFVDALWPDFDESQFNSALEEFAGRQRRYGGR